MAPPAWWFAFVALGCASASAIGPAPLPTASRVARPTAPIATSPAAGATVRVVLDHLLVSSADIRDGMGDQSEIVVFIDVTNAGAGPYTFDYASATCWMALSPDRPAETLSLTPVNGGEGVPLRGRPDDRKLGPITIQPGETRRAWIMFRGYRYPRSDLPRLITVSLPRDAGGKPVQLVIADPAGGRRWEVVADRAGAGYGVQYTSLFADGMGGQALAGVLTVVSRTGPVFYDVGILTGMFAANAGRLTPVSSTFSTVGANIHLTVPVLEWGPWPAPRRLALYAGGGGQGLFGRHETAPPRTPNTYAALSVDGGIELTLGAQAPAALPFPISFTGRPLPRASLRLGYTHWFASSVPGGTVSANSGGYMVAIRVSFF